LHWKHFFTVWLGESVLGKEVGGEGSGEAKGVATVDEDRTEGWSNPGDICSKLDKLFIVETI
jgi:hypothetical protein